MNNKIKIILGSVLAIIIIITILFIFVCIQLESILIPKYTKEEVVEEYKKDKALFLNSIDEILQEENICFTKTDDNISIWKYCFDREKRINISSKNERKKYQNTLKVMNNSMIKSVSKNDENIEFAISSPYGMDQYIVYLKNKEQYYFGRNVIRKFKIDNMLYYVEAD